MTLTKVGSTMTMAAPLGYPSETIAKPMKT